MIEKNIYEGFDMDKNIILNNCLFRYRKLNETDADRNMAAFKENKLYFSTPSNFNDPYDTLLYVDIKELVKTISNNWDIGMESYVKKLKGVNSLIGGYADMIYHVKTLRSQVTQEYFSNVQNFIDQLKTNVRNNAKIICFSTECLSMLMWVHYSDNHKGYVLAYDKREIEEAEGYGKNGIVVGKTRLLAVNYSDKRINMTEEVHSYLLKHKLPSFENLDKIHEISQGVLKRFISEKSLDWSYEKEWRLVSRTISLSEESPLCYIKLKPKAIIIGAQCEENNCGELLEIAKNNEIPAYKALISDEDQQYSMKIERFL